MVSCSVLSPFMLLPSLSKVEEAVSSYFSTSFQDFTIYALVPVSQAPANSELAIKLHKSSFSIQNLEFLLSEKEQLHSNLQRCKETILTLKTQVLRKNNLYYDEKYMRRMERLRKLNEDNKTLRELLKSQLENSEALRLETQNTVEVLREEFERLAQELNKTNRKPPPRVPQMRIKDITQR